MNELSLFSGAGGGLLGTETGTPPNIRLTTSSHIQRVGQRIYQISFLAADGVIQKKETRNGLDRKSSRD